MKTKQKIGMVFVTCLFVLGACGQNNEPEMQKDEPSNETFQETEEKVEVTLQDTEGKEVGLATISKAEEGIKLHVSVKGLTEGEHGFHIHEKGLCEAPSFESAGGHFNPTDKEHGFDNPKGPHAGDLENLEVAADGTADQVFVNDRMTWEAGEDISLFQPDGLSLMIHENPDDYVSQPAGDAGNRIVCGEIPSDSEVK